ncbi:TPA: hypothetical protein U2C38_001596 [Streptococcus suis]|nr:hypothetical protein [Streptococcus suis]
MAEQQNINQFGREELIDILQYLYVQIDEFFTIKNKMSSIVEQTISTRVKQATTAKYNRNGNIGGIIFALMGVVELGNNFFNALFMMGVMYLFGQATVRLFMWLMARPTNKKHSAFGLNYTVNVLSKKQLEKVTQEATVEAEHSQEYQSLLADKLALESNQTLLYFLSLIPDNFANLTDFAGMLVLLQDFRATNFREAANLWRMEQHQQSVMNQQKKMAEQLARSNAQISQLRDQAERLRKGQAHLEDAAARATIQNARANEKLANMERYGVHATIR